MLAQASAYQWPCHEPLLNLLLSVSVEAMRDSAFRQADPGSVVTDTEKKEWQTTAKRFLEGDIADEEQPAAKRQNRLPAFFHFSALDHMLKPIVPGGLSSFIPTDEETPLQLHMRSPNQPCSM